MAITQDYILKGGLRGAEEAANQRLAAMDKESLAKQQQQADLQKQTANNDDALRNLLQGKQADRETVAGNAAAAEAWAKKHNLKDGTYSIHPSESGYAIDPRAPMAPGAMLTPAQHSAEGESGKTIQNYAVSGGSAQMDKNQNALSEVETDLSGPIDPKTGLRTGKGKRDTYDRVAGKLLGWAPSLLGVVAPTEKGRMDKAQSTAVANIKATDSNPTQALIDQTMSRAYDPRADDAQNADRIRAIAQEAETKRRQIEAAKANYDRTGYATIGAPAVSRQGPTKNPTKPDPLKTWLSPKQAPAQQQGGTGLEHLSDAELQAMAKKLGL